MAQNSGNVKTNLRIEPFEQGDNLWQKYKSNADLQYRMSQTNTKFMTSRAHLQVQETNIEPNSIQPSKSELRSRSAVKFRSGKGRPPEYLFGPEKYMIRQEKQYLKNIQELKERLKALKSYGKRDRKTQHDRCVNANGPAWFQEPSNKQKLFAEKITESVHLDKKLQSVKNTMIVLANLGLMPLPTSDLVWKAIEYCDGDATEFLLALFRLTNPHVKNYHSQSYSINDRIILSAMTHLALPSTLREMHIRIPSPPAVLKVPPPKKQNKKKIQYASPYLKPLTFEPESKKPFVIDTNTHPNLPYFEYAKELKPLQLRSEFPEKSEYRFKNKIEELDQLIETFLKQKLDKNKSNKKIETDQTDKENMKSKKVDIVKKKTEIIKRKSTKKKIKLKKTSKQKPLTSHLQEIYTYYPIHDLDRQPTHTIIGGVQHKSHPHHSPSKSVTHIQGISKMDYHRRIYRYVIGGIVRLPDKTTVPIISAVQYEPMKHYCTYVHGGVACNEDGHKTRIIAGVSAKEVPDDIPEPPPKPECVPVKPHCPCVALYNEYIRLKELEHQKCLKIYRQFVITRQKKALKAQPDITYVIGGVTETKDGPVYTLSGVQPPKNQMFEPIIGGVVAKENEEPTLIVSGMQATRLYYDYMQAVKESLKNMEETSYLINGVTTAPDGTTTFMISGVSIRQPEIKPVEYTLEGVYDSKSNSVIVTDEGVTNPWFEAKYSTVISGIKPDENGTPTHIIQGLAKTGYEEPKFTYVLSGIKPTDTDGDPLFIISGVKEGKREEEMFKPKCEYLIGGVKTTPDNQKTLIVQGLVLSRDEIPQKCTYVIGGVKILPNGNSVPIIQQVIPERPIDCECLLLYRKYMELQQKKHGKCLQLYDRYVKKREREEKEAFKERMKPQNATYIIGGVDRTPGGDSRMIITGLAAKKIFDEYIKEPSIPQEFNRIIGGTCVNKKTGEVYYHIQGYTYAGVPKKPFVIIGGVKENIDGTPTYQISGVQALPTVKESICDFFKKKQHLEQDKVMIVGAVKALPDGTGTFVIDGVTTIDSWVDDEDDQEPEPFMCRCMRIYNRWLQLELKEYDEEIIEGVGRRVEDIVVPFINSVTELTHPVVPNTIKMLPMPKKYYKISCVYREQMALLKKTLTTMAEDGYPLTLLPKVWLLPHFRIWMDKRCGRVLNENDKKKYLLKSRAMWNHIMICNTKLERPKIPLRKEVIKTLTWNKINWARRKLSVVTRQTYDKIRGYMVENNREFWPSTMSYDFPSNSFVDVFYAYGPSCKPDVFASYLWTKMSS